MLNTLHAGLDRALTFYRRYGLRRFLARALRIWVWLPRLLANRLTHQRAAVTPEQLARLPFGVNVVGYVSGQGSLADATRLGVAAFQAAGVPFSICDLTPADVTDRQETGLAIANENPYRFNVFFSYPGPSGISYAQGRDLFAGRFNIILRPWEFSDIPDDWPRQLLPYDEVWVPSNFVRSALAPYVSRPVTRIPHPISRRPADSPQRSPYLASLPADAFVFFFVFTYLPDAYDRKNPQGLITAFTRAFSPSDNAWLVIKARFDNGRDQKRELEALAAGANVLFVDEWLSPSGLDDLMASCDCYVSLHRTEGFGLTIADAMAFGKPVITTSYSGNLDFTTPANSYLVDYTIVPVEKSTRFYKQGWLWAEPDVDHAAALMRHVYENPDKARLVGERARADIERQLSFEVVGELMKQRLLEISAVLDTLGCQPPSRSRR